MTDQQLLFGEDFENFDVREVEDKIWALESKGDLDGAENIAVEAVQKTRMAQNGERDDVTNLLLSLELRANFYTRSGTFSAAKDDFLEAISLIAGKLGNEGVLSRLYGELGYLMESHEKFEEAIDAYERALEQLGRQREPIAVDMVRLSNNLAFLHSANDDFDQAETLLLKALKLAHAKLGLADDDTTGVCNNVGTLYQKAGHFDQAREMHLMALEGRQKKKGKNNPDVAQSHGNLAAVYAQEGDVEESREHFESSIEIFQALGDEYAEDLDAVAGNYLQLLNSLGDQEGAAEIEKLLLPEV